MLATGTSGLDLGYTAIEGMYFFFLLFKCSLVTHKKLFACINSSLLLKTSCNHKFLKESFLKIVPYSTRHSSANVTRTYKNLREFFLVQYKKHLVIVHNTGPNIANLKRYNSPCFFTWTKACPKNLIKDVKHEKPKCPLLL